MGLDRFQSNVPIELRLESADYLYTLSLPEFGVREIAVPELTHYLRFKATRLGVSRLVGDQFCGYSHPDLIGRVVVQKPADFLAWFDAQKLTN